ncbi:transglutaminase-like domain-containing protein [Rhizobium sp. TRM95796]|uniref:transglutaminase-like domain-containing protein n=1 Tax=Rhizobium sp. TRM95796 TaxID=2979862 RepID=UPI0021E91D37|nr:transglutaminase family protein [Rhizobium sp. TRM95796]MCV3768752.1 transglutaminase family protein [Rhizobium sp. TRM95796]
MKIRAGFRIAYECQNETPMLLVLKVHPTRERDLCTEQILAFDRCVAQRDYLDEYGNACTRIVAPAGVTTITAQFEIFDSGSPEPVPNGAVQVAIQDLPDDVLVFLLGSRYCDTDRLANFAWKQFAATPLGWPRVKAVLDFVHDRLTFNYDNADPMRTAYGGYVEQTGVCRDFAHLAITLCRCLNIPARYCTGYLGDIGVPKDPHPMDFSAWFEVYLGGRWWTVDARHNSPRVGRILMGRGRDATDVALSTAFGAATLNHFEVVTEELV